MPIGCALVTATSPLPSNREGSASGSLVNSQAENLVLEPEFFFLELVKKDVVGVGSPLFRVNL